MSYRFAQLNTLYSFHQFSITQFEQLSTYYPPTQFEHELVSDPGILRWFSLRPGLERQAHCTVLTLPGTRWFRLLPMILGSLTLSQTVEYAM